MAERRGQVAVKDLPPKLQKKLRRQRIVPKKARKLNRSMAGNALLFTLMVHLRHLHALPLVMIINNALKPLDELYQFPPKIFVRNPNLRNFSDLFILMNDSWVPFSRYIMNTIIITVAGMVGHVIVASWAAYPLAKDKFPGKALLFGMVVLSMMFNWTVTQIPQYAIISWLHINNTYPGADSARVVVRHGFVPDEAVHGAAAGFADGVGARAGRQRMADFLENRHAERQTRLADAGHLPVPADVGQYRFAVPA